MRTLFFLADLTYDNVLWTKPLRGNSEKCDGPVSPIAAALSIVSVQTRQDSSS
jgi:hypothetical protein